jgi:hypothetical protein
MCVWWEEIEGGSYGVSSQKRQPAASAASEGVVLLAWNPYIYISGAVWPMSKGPKYKATKN